MTRGPGQDHTATGEAVLARGRYVVRLAQGPQDLRAAQDLRGLAFFGPGGRRDEDGFDAACSHMLIEETGGRLVACFRFLWIDAARGPGQSYAGQYYDLARLEGFGGPMLELGRFCIHPGLTDPDILRLAWGAITGLVDARGGRMLFGCASFAGTDPARYAEAFAYLRARHAAPERWRVGEKAPEVIRFDPGVPAGEARAALRLIPPLLRTYLSMGGWVSDHAVIDRQMNTLHVFTGVETAAIPAARARALRAIAG